MSRQAQTEIAILGGLSVEPMTGYGLRSAIASTLGHFWHESFGQIYPTLNRLEADGLVTRSAPGQTSGSVFTLTPAGHDRLVTLLSEPYSTTPPRNPLLLRLFFGRLLGPDVCRSLITAVRDQATVQLAQYESMRVEVAQEDSPHVPYWLVTIAAGEHTARAQLAWAEESLALLADAS